MDLLPIVVVIVFFQVAVIKQPLPAIADILFGFALVVVGLSFFIQGLETGLFPIGETLADALARKGSIIWLLLFSFGLGFTTTIAEPSLIAVADKSAAIAAASNLIDPAQDSLDSYSNGLRISVAVSVGLAVVVGVFRILKGIPLHYLIIGGYCCVMAITPFAPREIIGIAYDAGGVTTSTVTVPLVTALGVGLATIIRGRNPLIDGFGLIAFASLFPMIFVMAYGIIIYH
ncbi:DUF1538 family protein [Thermodesulfobacteriota bacterium]